MLRELDFASASEVVANLGNFDLSGGTHLVVFLRISLQVEEKLLQAREFRAQAWDTIFDAQRSSLCRSVVRSRFETTHQTW